MSKLSVKKPFTVIVCIIIILILGVVSYLNVGVDLLPGMNMPFVAVITVYPGAEPETVESEITDVLEAGLSEVSNIKEMSSNSSEHYSLVWMEFNAKADVDKCYNEVKDTLEAISLPDDPLLQKPIVMKMDPNMLPVFTASISIKDKSIKESNDILLKAVDKIKGVDGVSTLTESGLVDDLAYITMNIDNVSSRVSEFLYQTFGLKIELSDELKRDILADFKEMDFKDKTPEDIIDSFIKSLQDNSEGTDEAWADIIIEYLNDSKEDKNSDVYKSSEEILLNQYMFDEKVDEKLFFTFVDEMTGNIYQSYIGGYVNNVLSKLTPQTLGLLITAQDFEMPAGSVTEGVIETVVKIGPNTLSREEFMTTPLVSMDLGAALQDRFDLLYTYLDILSYTSTDGEVKFTKSDLIEYIHTARETNSEMFGTGTDEEVAEGFLNMLLILKEMNDSGSVIVPDDEATGQYIVNIPLLRQDIAVIQSKLIMKLSINDIADVTFFDNSTETLTYMLRRVINGEEITFADSGAAIISVNKESDKSTVELTDNIKAELDSLAESEEFAGLEYTVLSDDGQSINMMLDTVIENLLWGAALAIIILFIFLRSIKATVVVGSSIFISVIATFVLMYFAGITLNIVSMGGLALGVGMLVDNSIVVIENIYRMKLQGKSIYESAIYGAKQVSGAIISSTLTTVVVFLPIAFIQGMTKELFSDMALTICFSLLASLIVAITLVPMASSFMLKKPLKPESKAINKIKKAYAKSLNFNLNHKFIAIILIMVLGVGAVLAALNMDVIMFPETESGTLTITATVDRRGLAKYNENAGKNTLTYDEAVEFAIMQLQNTITGNVEVYEIPDDKNSQMVSYKEANDISFVDAIDSIGIYIDGGMVVAGQSMGSGDIVAKIILKPDKDRDIGTIYLKQHFTEILEKEEVNKGIFTFSAKGGSMMESLGLTDTSFTFRIYGEDLDVMKNEANSFIDFIKSENNESLHGITDIYVSGEEAKTEYRVIVDREKANDYGLTVAQVYQQVAAALGTAEATNTVSLYKDGKKINSDIYVYSPSYYTDVWYNAKYSDGKSEKLYLKNNAEEKHGNTEFFIINNNESGIFVKSGEEYVYVARMGEIPLTLNDEGKFEYTYINSEDKEKLFNKTEVLTKDNNEVYFDNALRKSFDLITMTIHSEDLLDSGKEAVQIPLYKVLDDSCFVRDENDEIIYRTVATGSTELIPKELTTAPSYGTINHYNKKKIITVVAEYGEDVNSKKLEKAFESEVNKFDFNNEVSVEIIKGNQYVNEVFNTLYLVLALAIVLIYLVMVAQFQSLKSPFIIMFTLPLAFIGGIYGIFIAGQPLSVMALMGLIVLVGVVVNNGIVFVDYCNQLIRSGVPKRVALIRTGMDRLRPILMTALTTIIALIVMVFDNSEAGAMLRPLAITATGGMIFSTVLTLFIVPIIFDLLNKNIKQTERDKVFSDKKFDEALEEEDVTQWDEDSKNYVMSLNRVERQVNIDNDRADQEDRKKEAQKQKFNNKITLIQEKIKNIFKKKI